MATELLICNEEYIQTEDPIKMVLKDPVIEPPDIKDPVRSIKDSVLLKDHRILPNLLKYEDLSIPSIPDYMKNIQPELTPSMRKIVTEWMLQVCQECQCSADVFMLAVNFMDRFLASVASIPKNRLQLIGTVCLLISSKFKETVPLPGERLRELTDFSVTSQEIQVSLILVLARKFKVSNYWSIICIESIQRFCLDFESY